MVSVSRTIKGKLEDSVTWIGATLTAESDGVRAKIKESIVSDICDDLTRIIAHNVTTKKELRSLIGKLGHCASLLVIMRPFLEPLWAALASTEKTGAPRNTIWRKQIDSSLLWFEAFFHG